jgi:hypothetical protein
VTIRTSRPTSLFETVLFSLFPTVCRSSAFFFWRSPLPKSLASPNFLCSSLCLFFKRAFSSTDPVCLLVHLIIFEHDSFLDNNAAGSLFRNGNRRTDSKRAQTATVSLFNSYFFISTDIQQLHELCQYYYSRVVYHQCRCITSVGC